MVQITKYALFLHPSREPACRFYKEESPGNAEHHTF